LEINYELSITFTAKILLVAKGSKDGDNTKAATIFEYTLQAKPFLALNHTYKFDDKVLEHIKEIKKFKLKVKTTGEINYDFNIKYHSISKKFTLNNNAKDQKGGGEVALIDGNIIQSQGAIKLTIDIGGSVELEEEFNMFWKLISIKTSLDAEGELHVISAIGSIRKFGIDAAKGPYIEDTLFFDGVKGTYFQKVVGKIGGERGLKHDTNPKNERVAFTLFEPKTTNLGRSHIFEMFNPIPK